MLDGYFRHRLLAILEADGLDIGRAAEETGVELNDMLILTPAIEALKEEAMKHCAEARLREGGSVRPYCRCGTGPKRRCWGRNSLLHPMKLGYLLVISTIGWGDYRDHILSSHC